MAPARPARARRRASDTLAYAPVGTHSATGANPDAEEDTEGKTLILAGGLGWLYGIGCVIGPFYGVGVGLTFPGGVLAGAGGGVGVVIGVGMGAGAIWGSGRGNIAGYSVSVRLWDSNARGRSQPTREHARSTAHYWAS